MGSSKRWPADQDISAAFTAYDRVAAFATRQWHETCLEAATQAERLTTMHCGGMTRTCVEVSSSAAQRYRIVCGAAGCAEGSCHGVSDDAGLQVDGHDGVVVVLRDVRVVPA